MTGDLSVYDSSLSSDRLGDAIVTIELRQVNNVAIANSDDLEHATMITNGSFGRYDGLWGLDFTPDGRIIFTSSDSSTQVISQMNADGSDVRQLTAPGHVDSALSVTPDGHHIVFLSFRDGQTEIWRMNLDGTELFQLTHTGRSLQPFLSADGRDVYYKNASREGGGRLEKVSIDGGAALVVTDKPASWGASSPDGKFFAAAYDGKLAIFDSKTNSIVRTIEMPESATVGMGVRWTPDATCIVYRDWYDGYWMQNVDGRPPHKMKGLPHEALYNFAYSRDGKRFAFVRGLEIRDVVLISRSQP